MAGIPSHFRAVAAAAVICFLAFIAVSVKTEDAVAPSGLLCNLLEHPEETVINTADPEFGWIYNRCFRGDAQAGYRIIVASSQALANRGAGDLWDSGLVRGPDSINIVYRGASLRGNADYYWRVQTMASSGKTSPFSAIQHFHTDTKLVRFAKANVDDPPSLASPGLIYNTSTNVWANRYPLRFVAARPVFITNTAPGRWFVDFGQDAFGYVEMKARGSFQGCKVQARFGEMARGFSVDTAPPAGSSIRYTNIVTELGNGDIVYPIRPPAYRPYDAGKTVDPPRDFGTVMPFRYFELRNFPGQLTLDDVSQERLEGEFNTQAASFESSSPALDVVWELCRNSMQLLTSSGIYIDGDRERRPYEADAYIQQMSAYAVGREFSTLRYTFEYLLQHPTWPTEWKFHMIFIAWTDYRQTGNADLLYRYYDALKRDLFPGSVTGNGLMRGFPNFPLTDNSDVIDWPPADRDGFVIKKGNYLNWTNSINNAFFYRSLQIMSNIATVVGRTNDADTYGVMAARVYQSYNAAFWNSYSQSYVDGVGTTHASAHANFFPLAFGLVPPDRQAGRCQLSSFADCDDHGMPASVYGAQYLLEALFQAGDADTAIDLMTTNGPRGWLNMIKMGSTLTTEAWNLDDKRNMDWNHAWGAAPANLISRFVLGVQPVTAGYGQILIRPQLGRTLSYVRGIVPTIRGPISIQVARAAGSTRLVADIPGNVTATVLLPVMGSANVVARVDGAVVAGTQAGNWLAISNVGSGRHVILLSATEVSMQTAPQGNQAVH